PRDLPSFPTRRSSDLPPGALPVSQGLVIKDHHASLVTDIRLAVWRGRGENTRATVGQSVVDQLMHLIYKFNHGADRRKDRSGCQDRKSTRLNSSHVAI